MAIHDARLAGAVSRECERLIVGFVLGKNAVREIRAVETRDINGRLPQFKLADHILTHALHPRRYLEDLRAHLAPGGVIYAYSEVDHDIAFRMGMKFSILGINNFHKQLLTERSTLNLIRLSGFEVEIVDRSTPFYFDLLLRAAPALAPAALRSDPVDPMVRSIQRWARLHMVVRVGRQIEERLPRAANLARTLVRHARAAVGRG